MGIGGMNRAVAKYPLQAMILSIVLGAPSSVLAKIGYEGIPPFLYSGLRYAGGGLVLLMVAWHLRQRLKSSDSLDLLIQIILQLLVGGTWFYALTLTQAINSSIIFLLTPILVYIGSVLFLHEPRSDRALAGSLIAFVGGIVLFGAPAITGDPSKEVIGNGLLLISSAGLAATIIHSKKILRDDNIHLVLAMRWVVTGLVLCVLSLVLENPSDIKQASTGSIAALLIATFVAGSLALLLFYQALEHMRAEDSASIYYLDALIGSLAGAIFLGEILSTLTLGASGIIIFGVLISHPVHVNRMRYYQKLKHSNFEEFMRWAKREYLSAQKFISKYF